MKPIYRKLALTALMVVGGLELAATSAYAQANTYADFPYQQGSLFYQYNPQNRPKRQVAKPAATAPAQPGTTYYRQPAAGTYVQPQQGYYYPQQGYYSHQTRRGLFGRAWSR